ncbi:hypothetical protein EXIGLDRAFT_770740 [Exidia glandulosa HHB12029]|uniref:Uncharacterized protein n=1 Tax=Exidia glandulosa HHB12029 TaxID=1314781 RepID=A0A165GGW1_EXIGL|nr:hypothetical protein EXIGLDRAFT_770740 [Exidia glandulosa HHB12029]
MQDPAGVKALLEQLKSSDSWQTLSSSLPAPPPMSSAPLEPSASASAATSSQISSLLSKLKNPVADDNARATTSTPTPRTDSPPLAEPRRSHVDPRKMTFQQALPHLGRLAENERVRVALQRIQEEQRELEQKLADAREDLVQKQRGRVDEQRKIAKITGGGITQYTAQSLNRTFERELIAFDQERVLVAWDDLVTKQQVELERLGVPTMFVTQVQSDRDRQQRVIQVLEGILAGDD